jgi:hypothetical protein
MTNTSDRFPQQGRIRGGQDVHYLTWAQFAGDPVTTACGITARSAKSPLYGARKMCQRCIAARQADTMLEAS